MKSVLLGFAAAGAIALSPVAVALPANAAPVTSSPVSINAPLSPASYGKRICSSNGVFCVQRITSVENGTAYISAWADTVTWKGWFSLYRNGNHIVNSRNTTWEAGGASWVPNSLASGGGYSIVAYQNPSSPVQIAEISFGI
jgi:hypothetical protein